MSYTSVGPLGFLLHSICGVLSRGALLPVPQRGFSVVDPAAAGSMLGLGLDRLHRLLGKLVVEKEAFTEFVSKVDSRPFKIMMEHGVLEVEPIQDGRAEVIKGVLMDHGLLEHETRTVILGLKHSTLTVLGDPLAKTIAMNLVDKSGGFKLSTPSELLYIANKAGLISAEEYRVLRAIADRGTPWSAPIEWADRAREIIAARARAGALI
ncbi:MAG: hypothetical protein DRN96_09385 [Thermoproteota archaeon]|nr:MAG: hypothetical protein DRN96_09385 [Candidatus Korarchaeota archaeon]RLG54360.1 MAG: hypothetical protein DRN99_05235 [Candidatus Korarchaeota archaeon]